MAVIFFDSKVAVPCVLTPYRDLDDPPVIWIKYVPYSVVKEYESSIVKRVNVNKRKFEEVAREVQKEQFLENVTKIEGYEYKGRPVTSVSEFYDLIDSEEMTEIIKTMESRSKLTEAQRKNFKGASDIPSDSEAPEAPVSNVKNAPSETEKTETVEITKDTNPQV